VRAGRSTQRGEKGIRGGRTIEQKREDVRGGSQGCTPPRGEAGHLSSKRWGRNLREGIERTLKA